jgi:hypothetical protein
VLIGAAVAYTILTRVLLRLHGRDSTLAKALGRDFKGWLSLAIYIVAIAVAFAYPLALLRALCRGGGDLALSRSALREADRRSTLAQGEFCDP